MTDLRPFEELSADHLRLILNTAHIGIWELDIASGQAARNRHHDRIFGYSEPLREWTYEKFIGHVAPEDREKVDLLQKAAIEADEEWAFVAPIITAGGERRWISAAGRPLNRPDGSPYKLIGHVIDITETKQRETRLALITDELNHRVRNMLSVIRSIVRLSARKKDNVIEFAEALEGRVGSLARSHSLLVDDNTSSLLPSDILDGELSLMAELNERVAVSVRSEEPISSTTGQGLALVLHELVTNAMKYGSLSGDEGSVSVEIGSEDGQVEIQWRECKGPPVEKSESAGFGTKLISEALGSQGHVELRFPRSGVECDITLHTIY